MVYETRTDDVHAKHNSGKQLKLQCDFVYDYQCGENMPLHLNHCTKYEEENKNQISFFLSLSPYVQGFDPRSCCLQ